MAYLVSTQPDIGGYSRTAAVHTLRKDDTGILYYTKVKFFGDSGTINLSNGQGFPYSVEQVETGLATDEQTLHNTIPLLTDEGTTVRDYNYLHRNYDQIKVDQKKVTYYVNEIGFLVARYDANYSYSATQNGATANWIAP